MEFVARLELDDPGISTVLALGCVDLRVLDLAVY